MSIRILIKALFNRKIRFFKELIHRHENTIWHLEYKVKELRNIREGIRQEYDRVNEARIALVQRIVALKDIGNKESKEEVPKVEQLIGQYQTNLDQFVNQMKQLDNEIEGIDQVDENNKFMGHTEGVIEKIGVLEEQLNLLKKHVKTI